MFDDINDLYQQVILDHCKKPRNFHEMPQATCSARGHNPLCGDQLKLFLAVDGDRIKDISFVGSGCCISKASASLLTEFAKGKSISEMKKLGKEELIKLLGADPGPGRIECALLGLEVLKAALDGEQSSRASEELAR